MSLNTLCIYFPSFLRHTSHTAFPEVCPRGEREHGAGGRSTSATGLRKAVDSLASETSSNLMSRTYSCVTDMLPETSQSRSKPRSQQECGGFTKDVDVTLGDRPLGGQATWDRG